MKNPKILHVNNSDLAGGAARAAYRIHHALRRQRYDSTMCVNRANAGDWTVRGPQEKWRKAVANVRGPLGGIATRLLRTGNSILHSPAVLPSRWRKRLNESDADVVHLHWVNGEMMAVADIGGLKKTVVWTLHDMWAFCGAEHYTADFRWRDGYAPGNRPSYESGVDLNRWTWQRKRRHWTRPMHVVTPSRWLSNCVRESVLMRDWPVTVVPNAIDTNVWRPVDKALARELLHLPPDVPLLLFGAMGGANDVRKGFDLLKTALANLRGQIHGLELVVFGQRAPKEPADLGFPVHYTGHLHDDVSLCLLYSAADVMVIPSRQDNLPNTGLEAHACGTPVVAFDANGLPDIVEHQHTGFLAKAFDAIDLAHGLAWTFADAERQMALAAAARKRAVQLWSYEIVVPQYLSVYQQAILGQYDGPMLAESSVDRPLG